ncbi:hypothetical protein CYMTET_36487 [Cymbomonas tetramitiformis]|uniref:LamG-like jellyroll fold domain-containing protein n=1 Tax=Cymbomonas tetramitiformis TaxID=36881 RepID=A0AAE0CFT5_9CHLO|nr:hypothetical protein CYMTET_36487 [Cymbomonas tetramitiformis]
MTKWGRIATPVPRSESSYARLSRTVLRNLYYHSILAASFGAIVQASAASVEMDFSESSLSFGRTGQSSYLATKGPPPLSSGQFSKHVTAEAWIRIFKHKSHNWLLGTQSREAGWALFTDGGEKACFGLFQKNSLKTISSRTLQTPAAWHHVAGIFDGIEMRVYVDANPGDAVPMAEGVLGDPGGYFLGGTPHWPILYLIGELADAAVWADAHSHQQIAQAMTRQWSELERPITGLLAHWGIDEGTGQLGQVPEPSAQDVFLARLTRLWQPGQRREEAALLESFLGVEVQDDGPHSLTAVVEASTKYPAPVWATSTAPQFVVRFGPDSFHRNYTLLSASQTTADARVTLLKAPQEGALHQYLEAGARLNSNTHKAQIGLVTAEHATSSRTEQPT